MKVIGAGLSRTGTLSLHKALEALGLRSLHYDRSRLNDILDGSNPAPDFRRYDDLDAVTDIPSAYFYQELFEAYPESKVILTVREIEAWWKSVEFHLNTKHPVNENISLKHQISKTLGINQWIWKENKYDTFRRNLRRRVYGSTVAYEFLYKKKYVEHNEKVIRTIPSDRLLVMNIAAGDGWDILCPFLDLPIPHVPFPQSHQSTYATSEKS